MLIIYISVNKLFPIKILIFSMLFIFVFDFSLFHRIFFFVSFIFHKNLITLYSIMQHALSSLLFRIFPPFIIYKLHLLRRFLMQPEINYTMIGQRIRTARLQKKLSQAALGSLIGYLNNHISHIEAAQTKVSLSILM